MRVLVTLTAYDPSLPGERTFYLSNTAFITAPSDTPASQSFDATLLQPLDIARRVQGIGGAARPALGELRIANADGAYDAWAGYAFDGRALSIRIGPDTQAAYPAGYTLQWSGTMDRVDITRDTIVVRVRDRVADLDVPLLTDRFLGDNVAPDGLEGDASLTDRVKPKVYGVVRDVPCTLVNAQKLIYHVSDNALASVQDVRDAGVALGPYVPVDWAQVSTRQVYSVASDGATMVCGGVAIGIVPAIATTTDGSSFAVIGSLPFVSTGTVIGMAYSPSLDRFCAVTNNATGEIATSDDAGATWTLRTAAAAVQFRNVRWCERRGLFIAVGGGGALHTSPTGVTWTAQTSGTASDLYDVAVNGPLLVTVGAGGVFRTSGDGVTWAGGTIGSNNHYNCFFGDGVYVMTNDLGADSSGTVYRSEDGLTWVQVIVLNPADTTYEVHRVHYGEGWWVAMVKTGALAQTVSISNDRGKTWSARYTPQNALSTNAAIISHDERWYTFGFNNLCRSGAPSQYANLTDLEDDALAPVAGSYKWASNATGSYVRVGALPAGDIRADVTHGSTAADRTAAQLILDVLADAGYTSADWVAADFTALDTADNSECGLYLTGGETIADCVDALARTPGAWWGTDASGDYRVQQLTAPSGSSTFTITENDAIALERVASSDPLLGLPSTSTTLRFANASTETLDGTATSENAAVLTTHLLAQTTEEETQYTQYADAVAEAARRQTLRGTMRSAYRAEVPMVAPDGSPSEYATLDLGAVGTLSHSRFGLSGGALVRILGVQPNHAKKTITLTIWK